MNKEQLEQLKKLLEGMGYKFISAEQRITNFDNKQDKGEFVINYQARFQYQNKLEIDE